MKRQEALDLVKKWTRSKNLVKHMLAVEAEMRALFEFLNRRGTCEDDSLKKLSVKDWGIAGLLHDADYEMFRDEPEQHTLKVVEELRKRNVNPMIMQAVEAHAWKWKKGAPKPKSLLDWSLYCCDELSGLIVACALVKPNKKLASVTVDTILKKWKQPSFAKGVHREQIELCEEKLNMPLRGFIGVCLKGMQSISDDLGL